MPNRRPRTRRKTETVSAGRGETRQKSQTRSGGFVDWFSARGKHKESTGHASNGQASTLSKIYDGTIGRISEADINYVIKNTGKKASVLFDSGSNVLVKLGSQIMLLVRMLKDSWGGQFQVSWGTVLAVSAALLYFLDPFDLIPDFIPIAGFLDDATIIGFCISIVQSDLKRYAEHEHVNISKVGLPE